MEAPRRRRPHPVARPRRGRAPASGLRGDAPRCHLVPGHARQARLRRPAERLARRGDRARPLGIPDEVPAGALRRHAGRRDRGVARRPRQSVIAWRAALAGAGLLAIGCAVDPVSSPPSAVATLDRELAAIAADPARPLASLSVLAIRHGEVVYSRQFGRRYISMAGLGADKPVDAATLFRIASISKLVTTIGVLRLEDFLTPGGAIHGKGAMWSSEAKPGARFTYANLGWGVLGTLMEKASGERFDLLMRRLVLDPLGMQGGYDAAGLAPDRLANLATLYRKRSTADDAAWNS